MARKASAGRDEAGHRSIEPDVSGPRIAALTGLQARLLVLVLLATLPVLAIIVNTGIAQHRIAAREIHAAAERLAHLAAREHGRVILDGRQLLTALAEIPAVRNAQPGACRRLLARFLARDARFANIGVIAPRGDIVCSGVPLKVRINVADRAYFRRALTTRAFALGDYQIGRITHVPVLVLVQPTFDASGRLRSLVYAALDLSWLNRFAATAALPPESSLTVLDQSGTVLARTPDGERWVGRQAPESLWLAAYRGTARVSQAAAPPASDGVARTYAAARLEGLPEGSDIHVVVGIATDEARAALDRLTIRNLVLLAVVIAVTLAIAWIGSEVLVLRRMRLLAATAQRLAAGEFSARTGMRPNRDELSLVGATFDRMAEALEQRAREAEQHLRRIARLNRVYAVLSGINGAILRIRDRDALLAEACRIAAELGQFRLAWIGLIEEEGGSRQAAQTGAGTPTRYVRPVAAAGPGRAYVEGLHIVLDPHVPEGQGPTALAVREGRYVVSNDIARDPRMALWRERARLHGFAASAAFPLRVGGQVVGSLNLYTDETGFFDAEEIRLLEELAADTSLGLEHIEQARRISYHAYYDSLTDLPNLDLFLDRLTQALARARHHERVLAVLVFDIASWRETVSAIGRHAGDQLLKEIARYLDKAVRQGDTVARLEAAEFGVVLADVARLDDVVKVSDKLWRDFPRSVQVAEGEEVFLKVRVGVAVHPNDGNDAEILLKHAWLALHTITAEHTRGVSFFAHDFNEAIQKRRRLERALHHALEHGEIVLYYQPVIALPDGRVIGFEALARWMSAKLGTVAPATFIRVAEETGLIVPLGEWVLKMALREHQAWRAQGLAPGRIAVNVSARQLREPDFVSRVRLILEECGWNKCEGALAIEVTETEVMDDVERSADVLRQLKALGLAIYLDDFGTGHSSLAYLQRLPVDVLKIDQGFVRGLEPGAEHVALVRAIVALARALGLATVAEGVESERQLAVLRELGCDAAQGFLFSQPVPPHIAVRFTGYPPSG